MVGLRSVACIDVVRVVIMSCDCRQTIDWIMEKEKEPFLPYIAGDLGHTKDDVEKLKKKIDEFVPAAKVTVACVGEHV